jgi:hypothetical protein
MRVQIYIARGSRGVWREAREAAERAGLSLADFVALALRTHLDKLKRQAAKGIEVR